MIENTRISSEKIFHWQKSRYSCAYLLQWISEYLTQNEMPSLRFKPGFYPNSSWLVKIIRAESTNDFERMFDLRINQRQQIPNPQIHER